MCPWSRHSARRPKQPESTSKSLLPVPMYLEASKVGLAEYGVARAALKLLIEAAASQCCLDPCGELVVSVGFNKGRVDGLFETHDCRVSWGAAHVTRLTTSVRVGCGNRDGSITSRSYPGFDGIFFEDRVTQEVGRLLWATWRRCRRLSRWGCGGDNGRLGGARSHIKRNWGCGRLAWGRWGVLT
jgi:hypothetical protein